MRDQSFRLDTGLFNPTPPYHYGFAPTPFRWTVTDASGRSVGEARTRAGARAALRALYTRQPDRVSAHG